MVLRRSSVVVVIIIIMCMIIQCDSGLAPATELLWVAPVCPRAKLHCSLRTSLEPCARQHNCHSPVPGNTHTHSHHLLAFAPCSYQKSMRRRMPKSGSLAWTGLSRCILRSAATEPRGAQDCRQRKASRTTPLLRHRFTGQGRLSGWQQDTRTEVRLPCILIARPLLGSRNCGLVTSVQHGRRGPSRNFRWTGQSVISTRIPSRRYLGILGLTSLALTGVTGRYFPAVENIQPPNVERINYASMSPFSGPIPKSRGPSPRSTRRKWAGGRTVQEKGEDHCGPMRPLD
ncbi:hypothetical protein F4780DRAFT_615834 [Xylariomycetidae sp. FL0641]|nr:hypothetical protein F4780DRAFT_615834 [Xylariomycetidae sp. FL0641]